MNKKLIIILVIVVLAGAAFFLYKKQASKEDANESVMAPAGTSQSVNTNGTSSNTQLDSEINKELDQLDKDIQDGSKDTLQDSDFNF